MKPNAKPRQILLKMPSAPGRCPIQNKVRYRKSKTALQALALARKCPSAHIETGSVYHCSACHDWHLTHLEKKPEAS